MYSSNGFGQSVKTSSSCAEKVNESPDSHFVIWPVVSKLLVFALTSTACSSLHCLRFHLGPWWNLCQCGMYSEEADASSCTPGRVIQGTAGSIYIMYFSCSFGWKRNAEV